MRPPLSCALCHSRPWRGPQLLMGDPETRPRGVREQRLLANADLRAGWSATCREECVCGSKRHWLRPPVDITLRIVAARKGRRAGAERVSEGRTPHVPGGVRCRRQAEALQGKSPREPECLLHHGPRSVPSQSTFDRGGAYLSGHWLLSLSPQLWGLADSKGRWGWAWGRGSSK